MAPPSEKASIRVSMPMADSEHRELQRTTLDMESHLRYSAVPYKHEAQYLNVPVSGIVPESLQQRVGPAYDRVSFFVQKGDAYEEPRVSLMLFGKTMYQQATISSIPEVAPAGYLKQFALTPYGSNRATTTLDCVEFGWLTDSLLGQATQMSQLADPRSGMSFEAIALDMSRQMSTVVPVNSSSTMYIGRDYIATSLVKDYGVAGHEYQASDEVMQSGTILQISDDKGKGELDLSLQAPYYLGNDVLTAFFRYKFDRPRLIGNERRHKSRATGRAEATLSFGSETLPRTTVAEFMDNSKHCFDASELGRHALANLDPSDRR